jgi:hypothetical protein
LCNLNLDINSIALQEVWSVPHPELAKIPGFNLILKTREKSRGGGVGFYLKDSLDFKILHDLSPFIEKEFECLTIETTLHERKVILSNIYRSPTPINNIYNSQQINSFNTRLESHLHSLSQLNPDSFVFLDSNINLLKLPNNQSAFDYLETVHNNGFLQLVSKASRIVNDSFSLIDHVLCKNFNPLFKTGTMISDISDHFINFICVPSPGRTKQTANNFKYSHPFTLTNMTNFRNDLRNIYWHPVLSSNNVDTGFSNFWEIFNTAPEYT